MISLITSLLGIGGQSISTYMEGKNIERAAKLEIKKIKALGQVEQAKALANIEASYDNLAQTNMKTTWKDEYLVLVISFPYVVSFLIPFMSYFTGHDFAGELATSWELVGTAPDWYQWCFMGIVIATFGLRWMVKHKMGSIGK